MHLNESICKVFVAALLILTGIVSAFSFIQVGATQDAEDQPYWGTVQNPQLTIEEEDYRPPRNAGKYCTYKEYLMEVIDRGVLTLTKREDCAMITPFGELTDGKLLQLKHATTAYEIDAGGKPVLVPNNDAYFYTSHIGNNRRGLFAYEQPFNVFEKGAGTHNEFQGTLYKYEYFVRDGKAPKSLKRTTDNSLVAVGEVDASQSGQWLIANLGAGRLGRLDSTSLHLTTFPGSYPQYSGTSGTQPDLAITNDGRYAALSGGFSTSYNFYLYDLSTCSVPDAADNLSVAEHCRQRELTGYMQEHIQGFLYAEHLQFSSDGTQLYLTARLQDGTAQRVTLTAPGQERLGMAYLALGDSYSSGEGDTESDPVTLQKYYIAGTNVKADASNNFVVEKCHISSRSYPFLLAKGMNTLGEMFKSIACSGAAIEDIYGSDSNGSGDYVGYAGQEKRLETLGPEAIRIYKAQALLDFIPGRERQVKFVSDKRPAVLTLTIGGNDADFGKIINSCVSTLLSTCLDANTDIGKNFLGIKIQNQYERLKQLLTELHQASPNTKIYVLGYPQFIDYPSSNCGLNVQLDEKERQMVHEGVKYINDIIEAAAKSVGVKYIDVESSMQGSALCGNADVPHVTGIAGVVPWSDDEVQEGFHPNHLGHQDLKAEVEEAVAPADLLSYEYCPQTESRICPDDSADAPSMPSYFAPHTIDIAVKRTPFINEEEVKPLQNIPIYLDGLMPGTNAKAEWHSEPVNLGDFVVNENGELYASVQVPESTTPGYHTLHVYAAAPSGEKIDFHQMVLVIASEEDKDGNGVLDRNQQCIFINPAGIDEDHDGIDDACDPFINKPKLPGKPTVEMTALINGQNQAAVSVSGKAEEGTIALITLNDEDEDTEPVVVEVSTAAAADGAFTYDASVDVSSLSDGSITASVRLKNDKGEGEAATAASQKDTVAPSVSVSLSEPANEAGWHQNDVSVALVAEDDGSGVEAIRYSIAEEDAVVNAAQALVDISAEGATLLKYMAVDAFGNESIHTTLEVRIDKSAPNVAANEGEHPVYVQLFNKKLSGTAADSVSQVANVTAIFENTRTGKKKMLAARCFERCAIWQITPYSLPIGRYNVEVIAVDEAGNKKVITLGRSITIISFSDWLSRWLSASAFALLAVR